MKNDCRNLYIGAEVQRIINSLSEANGIKLASDTNDVILDRVFNFMPENLSILERHVEFWFSRVTGSRNTRVENDVCHYYTRFTVGKNVRVYVEK